jgi:cellulose synthase/poly-beta-1,6-N-acetylglucosamine synthase-like glycosyltransferase
LAWAFARIREERPATAGVVVVDADCRVSPNLLETLGAWIAAGADAVQSDNRVSNADASPTAALRFAGFALFNTVRPRGKESLGISSGLRGTGMAFPLRTLASVPWDAFSVGEDREYHARLVEAGGWARFAADAAVFSNAPTTESVAAIQQTRWETGNVQLAYRWVPRLLRDGIARRDPQKLHAAFEFCVLPVSLHAASVAGLFALATLLRERRLQRASALVGLAQCGYIVGGLMTVGAPRPVYLALVRAPGLVYRKILQYLRILTGGGTSTWQRTTRSERVSA